MPDVILNLIGTTALFQTRLNFASVSNHNAAISSFYLVVPHVDYVDLVVKACTYLALPLHFP
jgi:hypothetical protein